MNKYVTNRVNTFGTVFLGSSVQCAECHNHKIYDPFTQREYHQLYDFFNRIPEKGLGSDPAPPFVKVPAHAQQGRWTRPADVRERAAALDAVPRRHVLTGIWNSAPGRGELTDGTGFETD